MRRYFNKLMIEFALICLNCVSPDTASKHKQLSEVRYNTHDLQHNI